MYVYKFLSIILQNIFLKQIMDCFTCSDKQNNIFNVKITTVIDYIMVMRKNIISYWDL